jgi:hypothetical protein
LLDLPHSVTVVAAAVERADILVVQVIYLLYRAGVTVILEPPEVLNRVIPVEEQSVQGIKEGLAVAAQVLVEQMLYLDINLVLQTTLAPVGQVDKVLLLERIHTMQVAAAVVVAQIQMPP